MLDVDTIDRDSTHGNILIRNIANVAGRLRVRLDADRILGVQNLAVLERNAGHGVVGFASYGSDRKTVSTYANQLISQYRDCVSLPSQYMSLTRIWSPEVTATQSS